MTAGHLIFYRCLYLQHHNRLKQPNGELLTVDTIEIIWRKTVCVGKWESEEGGREGRKKGRWREESLYLQNHIMENNNKTKLLESNGSLGCTPTTSITLRQQKPTQEMSSHALPSEKQAWPPHPWRARLWYRWS